MGMAPQALPGGIRDYNDGSSRGGRDSSQVCRHKWAARAEHKAAAEAALLRNDPAERVLHLHFGALTQHDHSPTAVASVPLAHLHVSMCLQRKS